MTFFFSMKLFSRRGCAITQDLPPLNKKAWYFIYQEVSYSAEPMGSSVERDTTLQLRFPTQQKAWLFFNTKNQTINKNNLAFELIGEAQL